MTLVGVSLFEWEFDMVVYVYFLLAFVKAYIPKHKSVPLTSPQYLKVHMLALVRGGILLILFYLGWKLCFDKSCWSFASMISSVFLLVLPGRWYRSNKFSSVNWNNSSMPAYHGNGKRVVKNSWVSWCYFYFLYFFLSIFSSKVNRLHAYLLYTLFP